MRMPATKDAASRMPDFGGNYLQPGCSVIHFYYSPQERMRFASFLGEGLLLRQSAVVAGSQEFLHEVLNRAKPADGRRRIGVVHEVVIAGEFENCLASLMRAMEQAAKSSVVRVLADFSTVASDIFEIEASLAGCCHGLKLLTVTQYDGDSVPARVAIEQFKTHSLTIVGDAFFYENRDHISPETYFHKRAAAGGR